MSISEFEYFLFSAVGAENVQAEEPLSAHTTFKIGGPAQWLVRPHSEDEIRVVATLCSNFEVDLHVLGLGSNVLASDEGVRGVVMLLADNFNAISIKGTRIIAQAGASNEAVSHAACTASLSGYEFASGIPGTVGGAAIMNAGAYDGEFKDVAESVRCLTPEGEFVEIPAAAAQWSYRHSLMADKGYIVVGVTLALAPGNQADIQARIDDLTQRRADKQPLEMPSAGSTFKRPEGYFAGKLIQDAGLRGFRVGGAQVSEKHTGFVVNAGDATAADVLQLISDVQDKVMDAEGVHLEPEVRMWGFQE